MYFAFAEVTDIKLVDPGYWTQYLGPAVQSTVDSGKLEHGSTMRYALCPFILAFGFGGPPWTNL